jgi:hypothetical protein
MAPHLIYLGEGWTVTQDPTFSGNLNLVQFHRTNGKRKLLDRVAEWGGIGWESNRWVPEPPTVPQWLIDKAVACMREVQP